MYVLVCVLWRERGLVEGGEYMCMCLCVYCGERRGWMREGKVVEWSTMLEYDYTVPRAHKSNKSLLLSSFLLIYMYH